LHSGWACLAVALVVIGCAADRPFDKVALIPSTWDIVSVGGAPVQGATPLVLTIGRSSSARVAIACGEVDYRYTADTTGATLSFAEQRITASCQAPSGADDGAILDAIARVKAWRAPSEASIELLDGSGATLLTLRLTTCDCPHQPPGTGPATSS
jgi:hypothetical protein